MTKDMLARAVRKFKKGDMRAFDYIYDCTHKVVYFVAYSVLRSKEKAEDITQDTYLKAVEHIGHYEEDSHFVAWLTTIAKRLAINEYNKMKHESVTDFTDEGNAFGEVTMPDEDSLGLFKVAHDTLSETDFQIVVMYAVAGYKRREIGKILDMPTSTVSHRYKTAMKKLQQQLKGENYD